MLSIHLKDLSFHAYHGVYEQEKVLGNQFVVNMHVHYLPQAPVVTELAQAVNYELLFALIKKRMATPSQLLETVVMELCHAILEMFKEVQACFVSLEKANPPIPDMQGSVVVSYQLQRES